MLMGAKVVGLPVPFGLIRTTYRRTPVVVVYFKFLRDTETLTPAFLLKLWEVGALLKEVCVGPFEVLQCLLQGLRWHRGQEPMLPLPAGQESTQFGIAQRLFLFLIVLDIESQRLVCSDVNALILRNAIGTSSCGRRLTWPPVVAGPRPASLNNTSSNKDSTLTGLISRA